MKRIIFFILFFSYSHLFGWSNLAIILKDKGILEVEKTLEKYYETKQFWLTYLQDHNTSEGYFESVTHPLVATLEEKKLSIFHHTNNSHTEVFSTPILIGKNGGDKILEGDLKTPIGIYTLTNKIVPPSDFYGPLAFVTNYPNKYDRSLGKTGDGIWIHGVPTNQKRDPFTRGCIALDNHNLEQFSRHFAIQNSFLIIKNKITPPIKKEIYASLLASFYQWRRSWIESDFERYNQFYSENFKKEDGTTIEHFRKHKTRLFDRMEEKAIVIKDINIIPYPNEKQEELYLIFYHQDYKTKKHSFKGYKEMIVKKIDESFEILYEG